MLDGHGGLAVAVLIFYAILLWPAIWVCIHEGFGRHLRWFYLVTLAIVRIVGASCEIAAEQKPSVGLYTAAAICNGVGLVPLLFALLGILKRVNDGMPTQIPERAFQLARLLTLVGLALAIAGGVEAIPTNSASEISTGTSLRKAASILLLVVFLIGLAVSGIVVLRINSAWEGDRRIIQAVLASLPFIFVRTIYYVILTFDSHSKTFNAQSPNVYVQAFMQILMEFFAFGIFLAAGLVSPSTKTAPYEHGHEGQQMSANKPAKNYAMGEPELGTIPARR